jgi:predicted XRE-type DNA-binding protein
LFVEGSGNVFADIGVADPEEALARAHLAFCIREVIQARGLTQKAAAEIMDVDQPKVSALMNGYVTKFSSERLVRLLRSLGLDVEIVLKPAFRMHTRGRLRVVKPKQAARRTRPSRT